MCSDCEAMGQNPFNIDPEVEEVLMRSVDEVTIRLAQRN